MKEKNALLMADTKDDNLVAFAEALQERGFDIYGSGGTAKYLNDPSRNIQTTDIATFVGKPLLGHRVVSLNRFLFAGCLAKDTPEDHADLEKDNTLWIEVVYVGLYDTQKEIDAGKTLEEIIERIDVGGPSFLSAGAKGKRVVVSSPSQFDAVINYLDGKLPEGVSEHEFLEALAVKAHEAVITHYQIAMKYRRGLLSPEAHQLLNSWN